MCQRVCSLLMEHVCSGETEVWCVSNSDTDRWYFVKICPVRMSFRKSAIRRRYESKWTTESIKMTIKKEGKNYVAAWECDLRVSHMNSRERDKTINFSRFLENTREVASWCFLVCCSQLSTGFEFVRAGMDTSRVRPCISKQHCSYKRKKEQGASGTM